ncbi:MAG: major capsid protein [Pseudomonadota bacterium]|nr:major capsid protein [Pseudomonadota bacterium]
MALTQLSDVIIPEVYETYQAENTPEKTAFWESGVVAPSPLLNEKANSGGDKVTIPFWKDLDVSNEPNISNDSETDAVPENLSAGRQEGRSSFLNNGWKTADLSGEIAGSDPMQRIAERTSAYWNRQAQKKIIAVTNGILAGNIANDSGDMVHDISIEDGSAAGSDNIYSLSAFTGAAFTMGDQFEAVTALAVHSVVYKRMIENDDIEFVQDSTQTTRIPTFMGRRVIVDDGMPVEAGATSGFKYTTVLFGAGAIGYGTGSPKVPVEVDRNASQGNGGGAETLWERKTWLFHPFGYRFTDASMADISPTNAELATAANWERVVDRKNTPLAFLITNG